MNTGQAVAAALPRASGEYFASSRFHLAARQIQCVKSEVSDVTCRRRAIHFAGQVNANRPNLSQRNVQFEIGIDEENFFLA